MGGAYCHHQLMTVCKNVSALQRSRSYQTDHANCGSTAHDYTSTALWSVRTAVS